MNLQVNGAQIAADLEKLAEFSDTPSPAITRIVYSESDRRARAWLKSQCQQSGLTVREDALGNLFARWPGGDVNAPAVGTGSHIDAIPHSGRFDGTVGVLGALESIRALQRAAFKPRRSIELLAFISEEPTRFGVGCLGSRMLCGSLKTLPGLDECRQAAGFSGDLATVPLPKDYYSAFVELHIEQGPLLERAGIPLGVVTNIAAPAALRVGIEGEGGHAGAVLMPERRDAFLGAAEIALAVEAAAKSTGVIDTVGTCGRCEMFPNVANGVPSKVTLELDIRDTDLERRNQVLKQIEQACQSIGQRRGLDIKVETLNADAPAHCAPPVIAALEQACQAEGAPFQHMVSRAYHDSTFMSRIAPTAMLFIPCRNGVSHRPDEFATVEHMALGAQVLARTLAALAA